MIEVLLTGITNATAENTIQSWLREEGDIVQQGEDLVELMTPDGAITIPAPCGGLLVEVYYDEGEAVKKGEVLCCIDDEESFDDDIQELE